jgi:hypothetical protein
MSQVETVARDQQHRIDVLRGMLRPGVQASMEDVVRLLRQAALDPAARFAAGQGRTVVQSLDELEHELWRLTPDRHHFTRKAQSLIDLLAVSYGEAPLLPFVEGDAHAAARRTGVGAQISVRV